MKNFSNINTKTIYDMYYTDTIMSGYSHVYMIDIIDDT